jgi:hypothetical protein
MHGRGPVPLKPPCCRRCGPWNPRISRTWAACLRVVPETYHAGMVTGTRRHLRAAWQFVSLSFRPIPRVWGLLTALPLGAVLAWFYSHEGWFLVAASGFIALLMLVAGTGLQLTKDASLRPGIRFGPTWTKRSGFLTRSGEPIASGTVVGGTIRNNPPGRRPDQVVRHAHVGLSFVREGVEECGVVTRWCETEQHIRKEPREPEKRSKLDLEPNDEEHAFDVACRLDGSTRTYTFVGNHPLAPGGYRVLVTLKGVGLDPDWVRELALHVPEALDGQLLLVADGEPMVTTH